MKIFSLLPIAELLDGNNKYSINKKLHSIINSLPLICFFATFFTAFFIRKESIVMFFFGMTFILFGNSGRNTPILIKIIFSLVGLSAMYTGFKVDNEGPTGINKLIMLIVSIAVALYLIVIPVITFFLKRKREIQCTVPLDAEFNGGTGNFMFAAQDTKKIASIGPVIVDENSPECGYIYNYEESSYVIRPENVKAFVEKLGTSLRISIDPEHPEIFHSYYIMPAESTAKLIFGTVLKAAILGLLVLKFLHTK